MVWTKEQRREYHKEYYQEHKAEFIEYNRKRRTEHLEELCEYNKKYYQEHKKEAHERDKKRRKEHPEEACEYIRKSQQKLKLETLSFYSADELKCAHCGEKEFMFLSIDHERGDGNKHRKELGISSGYGFYRWLRISKFPQNLGLRLLCMNCNHFFNPSKTKKFNARIHLAKCQCCGEDRIGVLGFSKKQNKVLCRNCSHALRWHRICPHQG